MFYNSINVPKLILSKKEVMLPGNNKLTLCEGLKKHLLNNLMFAPNSKESPTDIELYELLLL